jgi:phage terminase small subunit
MVVAYGVNGQVVRVRLLVVLVNFKEAEALENMSDNYEINEKQELFCNEYLKDRNATRAAIRAKYSPETAAEQASRLLRNVNIKARINELIKEQLDKIKIDVGFILREILNSATIDISDAYDENGNIKSISEMPEPLRKSIIQIESDELFDGVGKDRALIGYTKKIRIQDRIKSLDLLGRHLKMFTDVHVIPGLEGLAEKIAAAREREKKHVSSSKNDTGT